jgi:hypothetical protein
VSPAEQAALTLERQVLDVALRIANAEALVRYLQDELTAERAKVAELEARLGGRP